MARILWHRTKLNTNIHLLGEVESCLMVEYVHMVKDCTIAIDWKEMIQLWNVSLSSVGPKDPKLEFLEAMIHSNFSSFENIPSNHTGIIKILIWNCRGAGSKEFRRHIKEFLLKQKPDVAVLLETVQAKKAFKVIAKIGFTGSIQYPPPIGGSGGTCIIWNSDLLDINCVEARPNRIHAVISENNLCRIDNFNLNVSNCNLIDLGYSGRAFTWSNHATTDWRLLYHQHALEPPAEGWIKVNTYASCMDIDENGRGMVAIGGVFIDGNGILYRGFVGFMGRNSILQGELLAIKEALWIAKDYGVSQVVVESDSVSAVMAINGGSRNDDGRVLVDDILALKNSGINAKVCYSNKRQDDGIIAKG